MISMIKEFLTSYQLYIILGLALLVIILLIMTIINIAKSSKLKKKYEEFMEGNDGKSLEETLIYRLEQIDELVESNAANERNIDLLFKQNGKTFQKYAVHKYDALDEMGGKLSFTLAMLDGKNDGYILNVVHSREGCYSYVKEVINGNPILSLSEEETIALQEALEK